MTNHFIRLHGSWQIRLLEADLSASAALPLPDLYEMTIRFPDDWKAWLASSSEFQSQPNLLVELSRRFGSPTGLSSEQEVWLVLVTHCIVANVFLNGKSLGSIDPNDTETRFALKQALLARNRLQISFSISHSLSEADFQSVRLEIET